MPKISVIVPIYGAVNTLDACVASLLAQTFFDFELLLVDDGSTDKSGALCDTWQKRDARVRVMHKKNGGVQSAVLHGLANAQTAYCAFVDSDDTVKPHFLQSLWQAAQDTDADIVCCGFFDVDETGKHTVAWTSEHARIYTKKEIDAALDCFFEQNADLTSFCAAPRWNKLYRTALLRKIAPQLNAAQAFGEDTVMNLYALSHSNIVAVISAVGYCYTVQSLSATRSMSEKKLCQYRTMMQTLREAATAMHQKGAALQTRQDALFSALVLQTLVSPLPLVQAQRIVCALCAEIEDKNALRRFADTQPLHGRAALRCIAAGVVPPAVAAVRSFQMVARTARKLLRLLARK